MGHAWSKDAPSRRTGFTLLELMFVVVILAVLMAIAYPAFYRMRERAKEARVKSNAHTLQMAAEDFAAQNAGVYATDDTTALPSGDTLEDLVMPSLVNPFDPTDATRVGTTPTALKTRHPLPIWLGREGLYQSCL